QR
ncbi:MAG: putative acyltransferase, partial [Porphyrobacter sp. HL-46]